MVRENGCVMIAFRRCRRHDRCQHHHGYQCRRRRRHDGFRDRRRRHLSHRRGAIVPGAGQLNNQDGNDVRKLNKVTGDNFLLRLCHAPSTARSRRRPSLIKIKLGMFFLRNLSHLS